MAINPHRCAWRWKEAPKGRAWPLVSLEGKAIPKPKMKESAPGSGKTVEEYKKETVYLCDEHAKLAKDNTLKGGHRKAKLRETEILLFSEAETGPRKPQRRKDSGAPTSADSSIPDGYND